MFGDRISYSSTEKNNCSDEYNAQVDQVVKEILDVSLYLILIIVLKI